MRTPLFRPVVASFLLLAVAAACGGKEEGKPKPAATPDVPADIPADAPGDLADTPAAAGPHVTVDLKPYVGDSTAKGAYARKIANVADLIGGPAAQGRVGDFVIGNSHARFVIQGPDRHSSPCPWGGTVLDADVARPAGEAGQDNLGEYCLFFHLGRTQLAQDFEVVRDGKDGGAAVIAVTGPDTVVDFLNLPSIISSYLGGVAIDLPFDGDEDLPITLTRYYVLRPDEQVLRVVTAFRNDGQAKILTMAGELADSGGSVQFFNPASTLKGFGYKSLSAEAMDYLAFRGEHSTHALAPLPLSGAPGGSYLAISGVAGCVFGTDQALPVLLAGKDGAQDHPATLNIAPGATVVREHHVAVGTGELATVSAALWHARGIATGQVTGTANDPDGKGIAGLRISAVRDGATVTQFLTDAKGAFSGELLPGSYTFVGDAPGRLQTQVGQANVALGKPSNVEVKFGPPAQLQVQVRTPKGEPMPAKVTVLCDGTCPKVPTPQQRDVTFDPLKAGWAAVSWAGVSGDLTLPLAPGKYKVTVSRGPTYGLWPADAAQTGGFPVEVTPSGLAKVEAVLGKAVDTSDWLSGDFHVHAINSPDSPVTNYERVLTFLAEGVDVLVSTDHDHITDFAPYVAEAKAGKWLASIVGVELTTFDYGHYNAFPLDHDPKDLTGGAFDWGGGAGPGVTPDGIAKALRGTNPDRVVQINHPNGGFLSALKIDVKTGISLADPTQFRLPAVTPDPKTGDTGLFTTAFTAMELYNGFSVEKFNVCVNWWFGLLSRGVRWTGTAVSDTHNWINSLAGGPRSWVYVGSGKDGVEGLDEKHFSKAVNAMKVVGSNGPFLRVSASAGGKSASLGETLAISKGGEVQVEVEVQAPAWMDLSSVELYVSPTDTAPPAGEQNNKAPKPTVVKNLSLKPADAVAGVEPGTQRWLAKVTLTAKLEADGFLVVFVHGNKPMPEQLVAGKSVKPFAFTNPIFVDVDGGGYDHPPLGMQQPVVPPKPKDLHAHPHAHPHRHPHRPLNAKDFERIREIEAEHDH